MKIDKSKDQLAVVSWPGYGTFSWQGIQDIVGIHYARKTKLEIKEEEKWFAKLCSDLSGKQYETLLEDIQNLAGEMDGNVNVCIYDGILNNVPSSVSELNKQPV